MSHFFVGVIVPKEGDQIAKVNELMAPFDENLMSDPQQEDCHCINMAAQKTGYEAAEKVKKLEEYRQEFNTLNPFPSRGPSIDWDKKWMEFMKPWQDIADKVSQAHPLYNKPDPKCESCHGSGIETVCYNHDAHWDWFVIGGRWDGCIKNGKYRDSEDNGFNFGDDHHKIEHNSIPVADLLDVTKRILARLNGANENLYIPFAIVTPDGEWHEKGEMGWFGVSHNDKDNQTWDQEVVQILEAHKDCVIVGVDCHI